MLIFLFPFLCPSLVFKYSMISFISRLNSRGLIEFFCLIPGVILIGFVISLPVVILVVLLVFMSLIIFTSARGSSGLPIFLVCLFFWLYRMPLLDLKSQTR